MSAFENVTLKRTGIQKFLHLLLPHSLKPWMNVSFRKRNPETYRNLNLEYLLQSKLTQSPLTGNVHGNSQIVWGLSTWTSNTPYILRSSRVNRNSITCIFILRLYYKLEQWPCIPQPYFGYVSQKGLFYVSHHTKGTCNPIIHDVGTSG